MFMVNSPVFCQFRAFEEQDKAAVVAALRARVATVAEPAGPHVGDRGAVGLGAAAIDGHLPGGGLAADGVHEVAAGAYGDLPAAIGFCAALAVRFMEATGTGPVVWGTRTAARFDFGAVYGPGLVGFGLDPARLLVVETTHARDLLWTLEQAARLPGLAAVVGDLGLAEAYDLTASRRLQLAARAGGVPVLALRGHGEGACGASAALTRWRIAAAPAPGDHVGPAAWAVDLDRARGVPPRHWRLVWDPAGRRFAEPAARTRPDKAVVAEAMLRAAG